MVKRDLVVKPLELGGSKTGSLKLRNEVPLAKWLWLFFMKHGTKLLWEKMARTLLSGWQALFLRDLVKIFGNLLHMDSLFSLGSLDALFGKI